MRRARCGDRHEAGFRTRRCRGGLPHLEATTPAAVELAPPATPLASPSPEPDGRIEIMLSGGVEVQVSPERGTRLADAIVGPQMDFLVFDRAPQLSDKNVVTLRAATIHADRDSVFKEKPGEGGPGELGVPVVVGQQYEATTDRDNGDHAYGQGIDIGGLDPVVSLDSTTLRYLDRNQMLLGLSINR